VARAVRFAPESGRRLNQLPPAPSLTLLEDFCAPSPSPGSRGSVDRSPSGGPQKLISARDLARPSNMARARSVVSTTSGQADSLPVCRGTALPFRVFFSSLGIRRFGLMVGSCRVAPSGHSRVSETCRRLCAHRCAHHGRQDPRQLSALTAQLAAARKMSSACGSAAG